MNIIHYTVIVFDARISNCAPEAVIYQCSRDGLLYLVDHNCLSYLRNQVLMKYIHPGININTLLRDCSGSPTSVLVLVDIT